ncbi:MAG: glycoside hydrolase family protein [Planctomycetota bacterium]
MHCRHPVLPFVAFLSVVSSAAAAEFPPLLTSFVPHHSNPIFSAAGTGHWDVRIRERGWILRDPDAKHGKPAWHLWYTGYDGTREGVKHLGYATSNDGLNWIRHPRNPVFSDVWVEDMMIVPHAGTYYMFAEGRGDQAQLLKSRNGVDWTRVGTLDVRRKDGTPIEAGPYGTPTAWYEDGTWYLFYERRDLGVWLATSRDMKVWRNVQDDPVLSPGPDQFDLDLIALNQIVKHDSRYYASFHGSKRGSKLWACGLAVSDDLIHWKKYSGNPLFPIADNKSSGVLVHDGKQFRLYTMHDRVDVHFHRP